MEASLKVGLKGRVQVSSGHLAQQAEYFAVEPFGDRGGVRVAIRGDLAGDAVVGDPGSAVWHFLDQDRDRRVRARVGHVTRHLAHRDRVAHDEPDEAAPGLVAGLRIAGQRRVEVELPEAHQPGAALRLPDQAAELLVGRARPELAEQRLDVRLADAAEDAVKDGLERQFAVEDVAADRDVQHLF